MGEPDEELKITFDLRFSNQREKIQEVLATVYTVKVHQKALSF